MLRGDEAPDPSPRAAPRRSGASARPHRAAGALRGRVRRPRGRSAPRVLRIGRCLTRLARGAAGGVGPGSLAPRLLRRPPGKRRPADLGGEISFLARDVGPFTGSWTSDGRESAAVAEATRNAGSPRRVTLPDAVNQQAQEPASQRAGHHRPEVRQAAGAVVVVPAVHDRERGKRADGCADRHVLSP
jgi:hypothetical protein